MRTFVPAIVLSVAAICGYAEPADQATLAEQEEVSVVEEGEATESEESEEIAENDESESALLKAKPAKQ